MFDWGGDDEELERGGKPNWKVIVFIVAILIGIIVLAGCAETGQIPRSVTSPDRSLIPVPSSVRTALVPTPRPELKETKIYVVATGIPYYWSVRSTIVDWNLADRFVDFVPADSCPKLVPCVHIKMGKFPNTTAAETSFMDDDFTINIVVSDSIRNAFVAHSVMCHELGHVLGLPHISGTVDTCMTAVDGFFRTRPTKLDTRLVNSFGTWEFEKMYELSGKDIDTRSHPQ